MLGNMRAALITAMAIPLSMLIASIGMVQAKISGNLMSLGAIDFGIIVDGAVIIVENCLRALAERQHQLGRNLTLRERLHEVLFATRQMVQPSVFGQAIIVTVYLPILSLTGVEGKMFHPMAWTVIFALAAAFVLSLTLRARRGGSLRHRQSDREGELHHARGGQPVPPRAGGGDAPTPPHRRRRRRGIRRRPAPLPLDGAGVHPDAQRRRNIAMHAMRIPSTSLTQSTEMQFEVEIAIRDLPEVALLLEDGHRRDGPIRCPRASPIPSSS
jgi:cobalt-zinc-cadmium resistance protein CzcA